MLSLVAANGVEGTVKSPQLEGTRAGGSIGLEASEKAVQFCDRGEATLGSESALRGFLFKQHEWGGVLVAPSQLEFHSRVLRLNIFIAKRTMY